MNPFETNTMPIDRIAKLLYREKEVQQIKNHVDSRKQTVILGVEGVGKTSLLHCVFNREYRKQKALEGTLISPVTEFPSDLKNEDIYIHFAEMIINSVEILSQCNKAEEMDAILKRCKDIREEKHSAEIYFEKIVNLIYHTYEYHIVMVVDNFERFTSSKEVTMKHHETLRKLLHCSQYIVATNYDLNEDSLPEGVSGSLLLMNFAGNEIRVGGWSNEQTTEYINQKLNMDDISFSDEFSNNIYSITGGIPLLLNLGANYAYEYVKNEKTENGLKFNSLYNQEIVQALLLRWCRMMNPMQITAIRHFLSGSCDNEVDKTKLRCLYLRGALDYKVKEDDYGHKIVLDNEYQFCCRFFGLFCKEEGKLELAASKNPLKSSGSNSEENPELKMNINELVDVLSKKVEEENVTKEQLLHITKSLCKYMPDVTKTIDLTEELTDEILEKYNLNRNYIMQFDKKVQDFLYVGIQMDRCFENVTLLDFDYSTVYLSFCKAIEAHLNQTLVPVMKKISPEATDRNDTKLSLLPEWKNVTLGEIYVILTKRQPGYRGRVVDEIIQYCQRKQITKYPENWWSPVLKALEIIPKCRNDCPHTSMLKDADGKKLLDTLFANFKKDPQRTFMMKCTNLYNDIFSVD